MKILLKLSFFFFFCLSFANAQVNPIEVKHHKSLTFSWKKNTLAKGYRVKKSDSAQWIDIGLNTQYTVNANNNATLDIQPYNELGKAIDESAISYKVQTCNFKVDTTATFPPSCNGLADGSAFFTYTGVVTGGGLLTYMLDNLTPQIGNPAFIQVVSGGVHTLIAISPDGCKDSIVFTLSQPNPIIINTAVTPITCNGNSDGKIVASATGGKAPFSFIWNTLPPTFSSTIMNLSANSYTVTVTDSKGCTNTKVETITQPTVIQVTAQIDSVACGNNSSGAITLTTIGGKTPYTASWTGPTGFTSTALNITNLAQGNYLVTVTDANGCTSTSNYTIGSKSAPKITFNVTNVDCYGASTGAISTTVSGGATPYVFQWTGSNSTTGNVTNAIAGLYKLTVTDNKNCSITDTVRIKENSKINIVLTPVSPSCNGVKDGSISTTITGGLPIYTYQWSNSASTNPNLTNLNGGTYTLTVTDSKGCKNTNSTTITTPTAQTLTFTAVNPLCSNTKDGSLTANLAFANGAVTYTWNTSFVGATLTNIGSGTYSVVAQDTKGCKTNGSKILIAPSAIVLDSVIVTNPKCFGDKNGTIKAYPFGGVGNFTYKWNDANAQFQNPATALASGSYTVTITDANACSTTATKTINQPAQISIVLQGTDIKCFGGNDGVIVANVLNAKNPIQYLWDDPKAQTKKIADLLNTGTYKLQITDANACNATQVVKINQPTKPVSAILTQTYKSCAGANQNIAIVEADGGTSGYTYKWSNGSTNKNVSQLSSIKYTVTITDANLCKLVDTIKITELDSIKANIIASKPNCFGKKDGKLAINLVSGGSSNGILSNYNINWNTVPAQIGSTATDLLGGKTYTVTIADGQGCSATFATNLAQAAKVKATLTTVSPKCFGGTDATVEIVAKFENPIATYQWSANANGQTTSKITNVSAGNFSIQVTDNKGCIYDTIVNVSQPERLSFINFVKKDPTCFGNNNGSLALSAIGGVGNYTYKWSNGSTTNKIINLGDDKYKLTISDANKCVMVDSFNIKEPNPISAAIEASDVTCYGDKNGQIVVAPNGGTLPYQYSIDGINFNGINNLIGLKSGSYIVYVKDVNSCFSTFSAKVGGPGKFSIYINKDTIVQAGKAVNLSLSAQNGVGKIKYKWSGSAGLPCDTCVIQNFVPATSSSFKVIAIDQNGCKAEDDVSIILRKSNNVYVPTGFTPNEDAINSKLIVHGKEDILIKNFRIFDRWGEQLFESNNFKVADAMTNGWDGQFRGQVMSAGIYVWYVEVSYPDGTLEMVKGNTTLIR